MLRGGAAGRARGKAFPRCEADPGLAEIRTGGRGRRGVAEGRRAVLRAGELKCTAVEHMRLAGGWGVGNSSPECSYQLFE